MPIRLGDAPVPTPRAPAGIGPSLRMRGAHELGDECTPRPGRLGLSRGNSKPTPRVYTRGERTGTGWKSDIGRWTLDPGLSSLDLKTLDFGTVYSFFPARLNPALRSRPAPVSSKDPRMSARRLASDKGNSAHCWSRALRRPVSVKYFLEDLMRALRFLNLGVLAALIASSAVLYAQDEKQQEDKSRQEEPKRQDEARPASRQDETNRPRQNEPRPARPDQQEQRQQEAQPRGEMRPAQQEPNRQETARPETGRQESGRQETARPEQPRQESGRQETARPEDRRQETGRQEGRQQRDYARSGGDRGRIPEERFRAEFGREHHFAMHRPEVVEGRPRFQYGGHTFVLVDPWPPAWAYSDDCYIDYVDGEYFLFNTRHPEARLALELVM
jgi:hypothetical protein